MVHNNIRMSDATIRSAYNVRGVQHAKSIPAGTKTADLEPTHKVPNRNRKDSRVEQMDQRTTTAGYQLR